VEGSVEMVYRCWLMMGVEIAKLDLAGSAGALWQGAVGGVG